MKYFLIASILLNLIFAYKLYKIKPCIRLMPVSQPYDWREEIYNTK